MAAPGPRFSPAGVERLKAPRGTRREASLADRIAPFLPPPARLWRAVAGEKNIPKTARKREQKSSRPALPGQPYRGEGTVQGTLD